jgi:hypothetical protein
LKSLSEIAFDPNSAGRPCSACWRTCSIPSLVSGWSSYSLPSRSFLSSDDPAPHKRTGQERVRTLRHAGDLIVDEMQGDRGSSRSLTGEVGKAFETIYGVRLRVFKLKFGLNCWSADCSRWVSLRCFLPAASSWFSTARPKSASWSPSSAGSIASSIPGAN